MPNEFDYAIASVQPHTDGMVRNWRTLQWTTELPTVDGWYWCYFPENKVEDEDSYIICVNIKLDKNGSPADYEGVWFLDDITHWLGPLPVPVPPNE